MYKDTSVKNITLTPKFAINPRAKLNTIQLQLARFMHVALKTVKCWENGSNKIMRSYAKLLTIISEEPSIFGRYKKYIFI